MVLVETLVLGVDECLPESRVHVFVLYWCAVFVEVFADEHTVVAVYFGSLTGYSFLNSTEAWRLTEEPKEVDVYGSKVEKEGNDA